MYRGLSGAESTLFRGGYKTHLSDGCAFSTSTSFSPGPCNGSWPSRRGALHLWMYEANAGARHLYDALGGEIAQRGLRHAADGTQVASLRPTWRHPEVLLGWLTA